jgi:hypothetical protein
MHQRQGIRDRAVGTLHQRSQDIDRRCDEEEHGGDQRPATQPRLSAEPVQVFLARLSLVASVL